jgi:hypothetical protein
MAAHSFKRLLQASCGTLGHRRTGRLRRLGINGVIISVDLTFAYRRVVHVVRLTLQVVLCVLCVLCVGIYFP